MSFPDSDAIAKIESKLESPEFDNDEICELCGSLAEDCERGTKDGCIRCAQCGGRNEGECADCFEAKHRLWCEFPKTVCRCGESD